MRKMHCAAAILVSSMLLLSSSTFALGSKHGRKLTRAQRVAQHGPLHTVTSLHATLGYKDPKAIKAGLSTMNMKLVKYVAKSKSEAYVAVRPPTAKTKALVLVSQPGTAGFIDIVRDLLAIPVRHVVEGTKLEGKVPFGFRRGYSRIDKELIGSVRELVDKYGRDNVVLINTGHSLGAVQTELLSNAMVNLKEPVTPDHVVPFAPPRGGTRKYVKQYDRKLGNRTFPKMNDKDVVVQLPPLKYWDQVAKKNATVYFEDGSEKTGMSRTELRRAFLKDLRRNLTEMGTDHFMANYVIRMAQEYKVKLPSWVKEDLGGERMKDPAIRKLFDQGTSVNDVLDAALAK